MDILVLGIGSAQVDLLRSLSKNHTVHALSYTAEGPGREYSDHFAVIDIKDREAVRSYAKKHNINLVCSIGSDLGMITSAWVNQQMQLPSFINPDIALTCHKKNLLRKKLEHIKGNVEHKILTAPADIGDFYIPCIIKPVDSQGQRGVFLIRSKDELNQKFSESVKFSREGKVIAERYVTGPEVSVNTYIVNGEIRFNLISDRIVWPEYPIGIIHKHRIPSQYISDENKSRIYRLISDLVQEIGIKNGPLYSQIKLENNEPKLIEATPRLDGCHLWRLIKYATGVDLLDITLSHLMGKDISNLSYSTINENWVLEFMCEKPGSRVNTEDYDLDDSCYYEWYYDNGAVIKPITSLLEKCGYQIYRSANLKVLQNGTEQTANIAHSTG